MGSPFQRAFSSKSPLNQHKEVKKLLKQAKRENPQDRDHERIADLETEFGNAKLAHKNNSSKKQDVAIVEIERKNSMDDASMSRKASPLNKKNPHPAGTPAHDAFIKREAKNLKESSETMELSKTPEDRKELASRKKNKPKKNK